MSPDAAKSVAIGVDVGSSSARAVAVDADGSVRGSAKVGYVGAEGWATGHADPRAWRAAVDGAVRTLLAELGETPVALAIGGQSPCVVRDDGTDAVTIMHPTANHNSVEVAHREMWQVVRGEATLPAQSWDWILQSMGAHRCQGHWQNERDFDGFGPVAQAGTAVGTAAPGAPVPEGTPLVPGGVDAYMAFWAAGIDTPGLALDPGGRTGGIGIAVPRETDELLDYGLRSAAAGVDIVGGPVTAHGLALEWWSA